MSPDYLIQKSTQIANPPSEGFFDMKQGIGQCHVKACDAMLKAHLSFPLVTVDHVPNLATSMEKSFQQSTFGGCVFDSRSEVPESCTFAVSDSSQMSSETDRPPESISLDENVFALALPFLRQISKGKIPRSLKKRVGESDLVQDTLLSAVDSLNQFHGSHETFRNWLTGVFQNRLRSLIRNHVQCRKRTVRREDSGDHSEYLFVETHALDLAERESFHQESRMMEQAFQWLPGHYQQIIELHSRQGLSFREISLELNQSESAVRRRWSRAIGRWRELVARTNSPVRNNAES